MVTWLIKATNEFRVETMDDVENFHKKLQNMALDGDFTLTGFSWKSQEKKQGGEIIDEWFVVKATFVFNDAKDPENLFTDVEYHKTLE